MSAPIHLDRRSPRCAVCSCVASAKCMLCRRWACADHKGDLAAVHERDHRWREPGPSKSGKAPPRSPVVKGGGKTFKAHLRNEARKRALEEHNRIRRLKAGR